ncbi:NAD-dependent protein deacylase [Eurytemora carolleeae]|uniref:NAD-dependent protein deacylase n=1 Tax=Eurytemora carolleeae TaxID=1294199 RepID=UPI000C7629E4|nr:NAD-dependent protein deacylase [Eurytemora carolleeae]|eukprot:XP_023340213.1 NAD-dependent protein deacylase-like [Eurytemora affinis]
MLCSSSKILKFAFKSDTIVNMSRPSSDLAKFKQKVKESKHLVILTGAGVSAESGVPTFRGNGGYWRTYSAPDLATPQAFSTDPSLGRVGMLTKLPNPAHQAIAACQHNAAKQNRKVSVITQNIDELHQKAGSTDVIELHGSLFKTRCTKCHHVESNYESPICEALRDKGTPEPGAGGANIPVNLLPRCSHNGCGGLLRPHVVWFGEGLDENILARSYEELESCDLCLVVGTSSVVYPAAMFAPQVARRGVPVAEFNLETTPATQQIGQHGFFFSGPCGTTLPEAIL